MSHNLPKLLPKALEDSLYGQLDQRAIHLDEMFEQGLISDEFHDTALAKADDAWSDVVFVNVDSLSLGRGALEAAVNRYIGEIELFDAVLMSVVTTNQLLNLQPR